MKILQFNLFQKFLTSELNSQETVPSLHEDLGSNIS